MAFKVYEESIGQERARVWAERLKEHAANAYESANRKRYFASHGKQGLRILLGGGSVFWSRGWYSCDRCHGSANTKAQVVFEERVNGTITRGWRCR